MIEEKTEPTDNGDINEKPQSSKQIENVKRWDSIALWIGYNELAKQAVTLGERVFCRMARDTWEDEYVKLGGVIDRKTQIAGDVVVTLRERPPHIILREGDIELMRAAVAAFDAKKRGV